MALEPVDIAFRNAASGAQAAEPPRLPAWGPTGEARAEDVNRFEQALGGIGDARPAEKLWDLAKALNDGVRRDIEHLSEKLGRVGPNGLSEVDLLQALVQSHRVSMAQNLMAKAGSAVNETSQALLRGQ